MSTSFWVSDSWLVRTFVLSSWISSPFASVHLFDFFERACQQKNVVNKSQVWHASLVFVSQFVATALLLPSPNVCLHWWLENRIEKRVAEKISLFRASSNLEFITFHDRQQNGALVSMQTFRKQMCCSLVEWFRRDRVMPYRVKRRFENRPLPPRCLFTFTAFSNNESVRH